MGPANEKWIKRVEKQSVVWAIRNYRLHSPPRSTASGQSEIKSGIQIILICSLSKFLLGNDNYYKKIGFSSFLFFFSMLIKILRYWERDVWRPGTSCTVVVTSLSSLFKSDGYKMADKVFE